MIRPRHPNSAIALREPDAILYSASTAPAPAVDALKPEPELTGAASEPAAPTTPEADFDILGARIGDPFDAAVETVASGIEATERFHRQHTAVPGQPGNAWDPFHHATLLHAPEASDMVAVYREPPLSADRVTAVFRMRLFAPGYGPEPAELAAQLRERYGPPANMYHERNETLVWAPPDDASNMRGNCLAMLENALQGIGNRRGERSSMLSNGAVPRPTEWLGTDGQPWTPPVYGPPGRHMLHDLLLGLPQGIRLCGGVVIAAHLDRGDDGLVAGLHVLMLDPDALNEMVRKNRKALLESDPARDKAKVKL